MLTIGPITIGALRIPEICALSLLPETAYGTRINGKAASDYDDRFRDWALTD